MIQNGILYHSIRESDESPIYTYVYIANRPNMFGFNLQRFHRANSSRAGGIRNSPHWYRTTPKKIKIRCRLQLSFTPAISLFIGHYTKLEASRWSKLP